MVVWQCWKMILSDDMRTLLYKKQFMMNILHFPMHDWWVVSQLLLEGFLIRKSSRSFGRKWGLINWTENRKKWISEKIDHQLNRESIIWMYFKRCVDLSEVWKIDRLNAIKYDEWYCTMKNVVGEVWKMAENDE